MTELPDVTSPRELRSLFDRYGLKPHIKYGQNFLVDANIVRKIIAVLEVKPGEVVIEIGPGAGALTVPLVRSGANLMVFEMDRGLVRLLNDLLASRPEIIIKEQNALKVKWDKLTAECFPAGDSIKLVSNLPYNISGPFMYSIFRDSFPFHSAVLMLQKEVAQRLLADPGGRNYGSLSVICQYYTNGQVMFDVSKNVFWPRPEVDSSVIKLLSRDRDLNQEEEKVFWKLVQGVFIHRRKKILNSISNIYPWSREQLIDLLAGASIDPAIRPEQLTVEQFAKLARITYNFNNHKQKGY